MPPQMSAAERARQELAAAAVSIGRFQAPELFHTQNVDLNAPTQIVMPRALNLNRPLESITVQVRGRLTVTVGNYAAVAPEAFANLLQLCLLNGTHRQHGNQQIVRMTGATLYAQRRIFQSVADDILINGTRIADPGRPYVSGFAGTVAASPYDFVLNWTIPFAPQYGIGQASKRDWASFLLQPADFGDTLILQLNFGDESALGDPTGATAAFTAFGSAGGTPTLSVHLNYSVLGPFANRIKSGLVLRQEQPLTQFTAQATNIRLSQLQKLITTGVIIKSGTAQTTGLTAGVSTFATLTDVQLDRTQIQVDNKPIRNNQNNLVQKNYYQRMFNTIIPEGYFLLSFTDGQNARLAFRGDGLASGAQYDLFTDVLTAGATQVQSFTQEMILGGPFPQLRPA